MQIRMYEFVDPILKTSVADFRSRSITVSVNDGPEMPSRELVHLLEVPDGSTVTDVLNLPDGSTLTANQILTGLVARRNNNFPIVAMSCSDISKL